MLWLLALPGSLSAALNDTTYDHLFKRFGEINLPAYDWVWIKAQSYQESRYNPAAVSPVGATGLMQIMPGTGREMAVKTGVAGPLTSPFVSVLYGTAYMGQMLAFWSSPRTPGERLELAQASYNTGAGHVLEAQKLSGGLLKWCGISKFLHLVTGRHSEETLGYVRLIKKWYNQLKEEGE